MRSPTPGCTVVIAAFLTSGVVHLLRPQVFEPIVPRRLPAKRMLVHASGVAELACAVGMLVPASRRYAGPASAVLLAAVFPANVQMAVDAQRTISRRVSTATRQAVRAATHARLPMQAPLIRWALQAGRS
jgi:uncharacterized membrane protein